MLIDLLGYVTFLDLLILGYVDGHTSHGYITLFGHAAESTYY